MKSRSILRLVALAAIALAGYACEPKPEGPDKPSGGEEEKVDVINGTTIAEGMNVCGLISDTSGQGIPDVPVTDGYNYVVTDANGVYQMNASRYCRVVYMSVPAAYKIPLDNNAHLPAIYKTRDKAKAIQRIDFKLEPQELEKKFTLVMIGDPQCRNTSEVSRYTQETVPSMMATLNDAHASGKYPNAYGVTLGDIVFDSTNMWGNMRQSMSNLKLQDGGWFPIFQCIGNHDHNSLTQNSDFDATEEFFKYFGPTDYSFNRGEAHIIVMDDIQCTNVKKNSSPNGYTWEYKGGITQTQLNWLKQDLSYVADKGKKMVVLCMHIPMRAGATDGSGFNKSAFYTDVLDLLRQFGEAHIMIGHTHYSQNYIHESYVCKNGQPIYEHIHGAACGAWWCCDSNVTGQPNGYSVYEVEGNSIVNWIDIGSNRTADYQLRVYDGNQIYSGSQGYTYQWCKTSNIGGTANITATGSTKLKNAFVAEVFNDDDKNWKVEMWQNGVKIGDFQKLANGSCCNVCLSSYFFNELGKNTTSWANKTASHYWYFVPKSGNPSAEKDWEVKAIQTIPMSGKVNNYYCSSLTIDYSAF